MLTYIKGIVTELSPLQLIMEANDVGYCLRISLNTYQQVRALGVVAETKIKILTLVHIKEDAHTLYGFYTEYERRVFKLLVTVNGIGYSTASTILSYMSPGDLELAVLERNISLLNSIKGIGNKSANRIILELQDKVSLSAGSAEGSGHLDGGGDTLKTLASSALVTLGFQKNHVENTISKLMKTGSYENVETLVKEALKYL